MYRIIVTGPAANDLNKAVLYIANELNNKDAALNLIEETEKTVHSLSEMPGRYPLVQDTTLAELGIRMVPIKNYLVFYVIREETKSITILRFLYARRNWKNILGQ